MSESTAIDNRLASERIGRLVWRYSLPAIVGTVVMSLYNMVDRIFIGQGVEALAISGLALTFPFMNVLTSFGMLVGTGAATRISIALGEGNRERAERILGNALVLTFIVTGSVIVGFSLFLDDLLRLFGGTEATVGYAAEYLRIIIPAAIFSALNYNFNSIMRATGHPRKAMWTMIICAGINVTLDAVFIFGLDMGIRGAAHATNLSFVAGSAWVLHHFCREKSNVRFHRRHLRLQGDVVRSILSLGLSPFSMHIALSLVIVLINVSLLQYGGDPAIGAYGIVNSITTLVVMIIIGLNQGIQPIIGYNYGARLHNRMFAVLRVAVVAGTCVSTAGFAAGTFLPETLVRLFTDDADMLAVATRALRITVVTFPIIGAQIVISHFFQSIGQARMSVFLSLTRQLIFFIPALFILPPFFGLDGAWAAQPVSDALATFVTAVTIGLYLKKHKMNGREAAPFR